MKFSISGKDSSKSSNFLTTTKKPSASIEIPSGNKNVLLSLSSFNTQLEISIENSLGLYISIQSPGSKSSEDL